ncbi:TPA: DNA methyltransferase [Enterobacter hormaechei]
MSFWQKPLSETIVQSKKLIGSDVNFNVVANWFEGYQEDAPTSSNQGTSNLAFQRWFRFKEAFSPKFVTDTLNYLPYKVGTCLDPFLGSGTTSVTCKMLGINSIGTEVNPFLADLVEAKLTTVDTDAFYDSYSHLIKKLTIMECDYQLTPGMPLSFNEPGIKERYVFSNSAYSTIRAILRCSHALSKEHHRLLKVLLGSVLVENSNTIVNGKGRRYRNNWNTRIRTGLDVIKSLNQAVDETIKDIASFSYYNNSSHSILRGDTRALLPTINHADVVIFSPPYPNSFDYTDVYNIELWMLDYLKSSDDNRSLRNRTLRSHVQAKWTANPDIELKSNLLMDTITTLQNQRGILWNKNIPEMISYYFEDLYFIFMNFKRILKRGHHAIVAIGDSRYAGVHVDVGDILEEIIQPLGFILVEKGEIRSMRSSSQHGGKFELSEHCLVFEKI